MAMGDRRYPSAAEALEAWRHAERELERARARRSEGGSSASAAERLARMRVAQARAWYHAAQQQAADRYRSRPGPRDGPESIRA